MTKFEIRINDQIPMTNETHKFDLEERTASFGEQVVGFAKRIRATPVNTPLISQLVRAATSVGANYCEANDCCSKKRTFDTRLESAGKRPRKQNTG
jgi:hypothetical protein